MDAAILVWMLLDKGKVTGTSAHCRWLIKDRWQKHSSTVQLGEAVEIIGVSYRNTGEGVTYWIRQYSKAAAPSKAHLGIGDRSPKLHP